VPNPGKPQELKKLIGSRNYKKESDIEVIEVDEIPLPVRRLDESGLNLWRRVWSMGSIWLRDSDLELLQMTCEQMDERDVLRAYVMENMDAWHERAGLRQLEREIQSNLIQLGFTPQARAKLGIQEIVKESKLDQLRKMMNE
jgi:phage terminase small subunit